MLGEQRAQPSRALLGGTRHRELAQRPIVDQGRAPSGKRFAAPHVPCRQLAHEFGIHVELFWNVPLGSSARVAFHAGHPHDPVGGDRLGELAGSVPVGEHCRREREIDLELVEAPARPRRTGTHMVDAALDVVVPEERGRDVHDVCELPCQLEHPRASRRDEHGDTSVDPEAQREPRAAENRTALGAELAAPHRSTDRDELTDGTQWSRTRVAPRRHPHRRRILHPCADAEDHPAARVLVHAGERARRRLRMACVGVVTRLSTTTLSDRARQAAIVAVQSK